jgi:hypothetical protein
MAKIHESPPEGHPETDWTKWEPAGEGDGIPSHFHSYQLHPLRFVYPKIDLTNTTQSAPPAP